MPLVKFVDVSDAAPLHLRAMRGAAFELDLTYGTGNVDFTGRSFKMTCVVEKNQTTVFAITEATDEITVGVIEGKAAQLIHVFIPEVVTKLWPERLCEYTIQMDQGSGYWVPVISGKFPIKPNKVAAAA